MAERMVATHKGATLTTNVFVTIQFEPHIATTMAKSPSAARRERNWFMEKSAIVRSSEAKRPGEVLDTGSIIGSTGFQ
jgi:hypothetical protein